MSEETMINGWISSLDVEVCDQCLGQFIYTDMNDFDGERICNKCFEENKADYIRDEREDYEQV